MKVIILAAESKNDIDENKPKCLVEVGGKTLLQRNVDIIKGYGINDIVVVVGKRGSCWTEENYEKIKNTGIKKMIVNEINDQTYQAYSLLLAMKEMEKDTILALDGDIYFNKETLETLLYYKKQNIVLSRPVPIYSMKGGKVKVDENGKIIYCGMGDPGEFPWDLYSGITKIGKEMYDDFKKIIEENWREEILFVINKLSKKYEIYGSRVGYEFSGTESGGYSNISVVPTVRKEAIGGAKGIKKLMDEINFIKKLPEECKKHFPEAKNITERENQLYYEMPKYGLPSLRSLLFSGTIGAEDALRIIDKILNFLFTKMYTRDTFQTPAGYMDEIHFRRVWKRLNTLGQKSDFFKELIKKNQIHINGIEYKNIPDALSFLETNNEIIKKCTPKVVSPWCHSDLHFSNFLVDLKNDHFIFLDPRGYEYCDYYYDFGKLWHSINGLYDFISENKFILTQITPDKFSYEFIDQGTLKEYLKIKKKLLKLLQKYSPEPIEQLMMKVRFNEAIHFCSFMPFLLEKDKNEKRALLSYLIGVKLINEFNKKYCKDFDSFININKMDSLEKIRKIEETKGKDIVL